MEENKQQEQTPVTEKKIMKIEPLDKANLTTAAKWAKFIAIVQFVMLGLGAVGMVFVLLAVSVAGVTLPPTAGFPLAAGGVVTIVCSVVFLALFLVAFLPALYTYRFATKSLEAIEFNNGEALSDSFANLRRYFKFTGMMLIFVLGLYALFFVGAMFVGIGAAIGSAIG